MSLSQTKTVTEKYTVSALLDQIQSGLLLDSHPLQRHADQHSKAYKDAFISTVIKNEDFDSLKVCEQRKNNGIILWLIDGLQRVSEMQDFRNGAIRLGRNIELSTIKYRVTRTDKNGIIIKNSNGMPEYEIKEYDIKGKVFNDLPKELQDQFDMCPVDVVKHLDCTDQEIAYHIRRYNKQVPLNGSQNAMTYADRCAAKIKEVAQNRFFLDCGHYTENERNKGGIDRVILESVMSTFHLENWKKNAIQMGEYANENVMDSEIAKIGEYFTRLYPIAEGGFSDIFNSKNTFIFIPVFDVFVKTGKDDSDFGEFLYAFENILCSEKIDGVSYTELAESRATKDKARVIEKVEHLKKLLFRYFEIEETNSENVSVEKFIADAIGVSVRDVEEDMSLYTQCLDDAMDIAVPFDSKLRESDNRISMLAAVAYSIVNDINIEEWLEWYVQDHSAYLTDPKENFKQMVISLNNFDKRKIA